MFVGYYNSEIGIIKVIASEEAILLIDFIEDKEKEKLNDLIIKCIKQLKEYFEGSRKDFDFPFKLQGTEFQKIVWEFLLNIPYGEMLSYKEVAKGIRKEKSVRAVANAIGANKLLILVPCHRVIGTNGTLTGFRAGLKRKEYLLNLENQI